MTDYVVTDTHLTNIADQLRIGEATNDMFEFPTEFVSAVEDITRKDKHQDVQFFDYDGTILYEYSAAQFQKLTAMPPNPDRTSEGLTAQGWNWTLSEAKAQLAISERIYIGQVYVPTDGKTHIFVEYEDSPFELDIQIQPSTSSTCIIDWGDGNSTNLSSSSMSYRNHLYSSGGTYEIKITPATGQTITIGGGGSSNQSITRGYNSGCYSSQCKVKCIWLGNNVKIKGYAFYHIDGLEKISIPNSITFDSNTTDAFAACPLLKHITFPNVSFSLGYGACTNNYGLVSVSQPLGVTLIGDYAFHQDYELMYCIIPSNVTELGQYAFCYSHVEKMIVPNSVTTLGLQALAFCRNLEKCEIKNATATLGGYFFDGCERQKTVTLPSQLTTIPYRCFANCESLRTVNIPNTVTVLGQYAFYCCSNLETINIPSGVTSLPVDVFGSCSAMNKLTIPASVTSFSDYVLPNQGRELHQLSTTPPTITSTSLSGNWSTGHRFIYVPKSADQTVLNAYKTATNWSAKAGYMQEEPE